MKLNVYHAPLLARVLQCHFDGNWTSAIPLFCKVSSADWKWPPLRFLQPHFYGLTTKLNICHAPLLMRFLLQIENETKCLPHPLKFCEVAVANLRRGWLAPNTTVTLIEQSQNTHCTNRYMLLLKNWKNQYIKIYKLENEIGINK